MNGVKFPVETGIFSLCHCAQPPIQWVIGALPPGIKQLVHEANHSSPSSAEVKNAWSYTSSPS